MKHVYTIQVYLFEYAPSYSAYQTPNYDETITVGVFESEEAAKLSFPDAWSYARKKMNAEHIEEPTLKQDGFWEYEMRAPRYLPDEFVIRIYIQEFELGKTIG